MTKLTPLQRKCLGHICLGQWFYAEKTQAQALVRKGLVTEHRGHVLVEYHMTQAGFAALAAE